MEPLFSLICDINEGTLFISSHKHAIVGKTRNENKKKRKNNKIIKSWNEVNEKVFNKFHMQWDVSFVKWEYFIQVEGRKSCIGGKNVNVKSVRR